MGVGGSEGGGWVGEGGEAVGWAGGDLVGGGWGVAAAAGGGRRRPRWHRPGTPWTAQSPEGGRAGDGWEAGRLKFVGGREAHALPDACHACGASLREAPRP